MLLSPINLCPKAHSETSESPIRSLATYADRDGSWACRHQRVAGQGHPCPTVRMAEAETMMLALEKTNIPFPKLENLYRDEETGWVCVVMEYAQGQQLDRA